MSVRPQAKDKPASVEFQWDDPFMLDEQLTEDSGNGDGFLAEVVRVWEESAQPARDAFAGLPDVQQAAIIDFLNSLVLFPPDDTASNLNPGDRNAAGFPQNGHGNIRLPALFNDPMDPE